MSIQNVGVGRACLGYSRLTSLGSVSTCPFARGKVVEFQPESQSIRYTLDGSTPTSTVGFLVTAGTTVCYEGDLSLVRFIEIGASATLNVHVFG